jgi:hypothetical protein
MVQPLTCYNRPLPQQEGSLPCTNPVSEAMIGSVCLVVRAGSSEACMQGESLLLNRFVRLGSTYRSSHAAPALGKKITENVAYI